MTAPEPPLADEASVIVLLPFAEGHVPGVLGLWERAVGPAFPLREALLRQVTLGNGDFRPGDAVVAMRHHDIVGFGLLGRYRGEDADRAAWRSSGWVTAIVVEPGSRRLGIGTGMHRHLLDTDGDGLDPARVAAGGGPVWLFPGPPDDLPGARAFFASLGYRFASTVADVRADISGSTMPDESRHLMARHRLVVRRANAIDREVLSRFVRDEFGLGWWANADRFFRSGGAIGDWLLLTQDGRIVGMAQLHHAGQAIIGPARFWRPGPHMGGLGPIGIASSLRGLGLGLAFLHATMASLRDLGVDEAVADWTTLLDFYAKAGFTTWHTYATP